jgi:tRNA (adenine37-N6)-methyltransferase
VEVFAEYAEGLQDLEAFSHVILIYALHRSEGYSLRIKPFPTSRIELLSS